MTLLTTVQRLPLEALGACIIRCMVPALCCFVLGSSTQIRLHSMHVLGPTKKDTPCPVPGNVLPIEPKGVLMISGGHTLDFRESWVTF
jgi:hypothetical protein